MLLQSNVIAQRCQRVCALECDFRRLLSQFRRDCDGNAFLLHSQFFVSKNKKATCERMWDERTHPLIVRLSLHTDKLAALCVKRLSLRQAPSFGLRLRGCRGFSGPMYLHHSE